MVVVQKALAAPISIGLMQAGAYSLLSCVRPFVQDRQRDERYTFHGTSYLLSSGEDRASMTLRGPFSMDLLGVG